MIGSGETRLMKTEIGSRWTAGDAGDKKAEGGQLKVANALKVSPNVLGLDPPLHQSPIVSSSLSPSPALPTLSGTAQSRVR